MNGIRYQRCGDCAHAFFFRRGFCPKCGSRAVNDQTTEKAGVIVAITEVTRAPSEAWRQFAPYLLCLVEMDEGFRMMAHGSRSLSIGDRVSPGRVQMNGTDIPFFTNAPGK